MPHHCPPAAFKDSERVAHLGDCLLRRHGVNHDDVGRVPKGKAVISQIEETSRALDLLLFGGEALEFLFHCVDLGEICRDFVIATALARQQMEAAAR